MQFTKVHQDLAKPVYEAIPKIAEKAGKKCPKCKGSGLVRTKHYPTGSFNTEATINCLACNGIGKVKGKWEWKPEAGEFFLCKTEYMDQGKTIQYDRLMLVPLEFRIEVNVYTGQSLIINNERISLEACVPLLHWERIVKILEGMGYKLDVFKTISNQFTCSVHRNSKTVIVVRAKSCQEAVQKAILALVKELK